MTESVMELEYFYGADYLKERHFQVGLLPKARCVRGFQGGIINYVETIHGVQVGVFGPRAYQDVHGVQLSGFIAETCHNVHGVQAAGFMAAAENVNIFQFSPGAASAYGTVHGLQIGGCLAHAKEVDGVQVGAFCISSEPKTSYTGRQIGLLLWGPNNHWYNPSVGYQKITPASEKKNFPTLESVVTGWKELKKAGRTFLKR